MEDDEKRALRPDELAALRRLLDPLGDYVPPLDTVATLLGRELITVRDGVIRITQAGRDVLAANDGRKTLH